MNGPPGAGQEDDSTGLARRCNEICDRFEAAWKGVQNGQPKPLIEWFLAALPESYRAVILHELILLDVHYRHKFSISNTADDYRSCFPDLDPAWLNEALKPKAVDAAEPASTAVPASPAADSVSDIPGLGLTHAIPNDESAQVPPIGMASFPRYTRGRLHATGGIGQVWLAHDHAIGREVALKQLRPDRLADPRLRTRFLAEARITGQLEHPGIVPVYEVTWPQDEAEPFYTMRFVKGRTLREAVADYQQKRRDGQAGPLDLRGLLDAFVTVCNVVAFAHSRRVLHRDLKGQNVVLGDYGEVFLLDWGLAKVMRSTGQDETDIAPALQPHPGTVEIEATVQGQVLGTPGYMAPEQAAGDSERLDERTDVYGLGAILYEILTGRAPFRGEDPATVLACVRNEAPVRPRALVSHVPRALEAICLKALSKAPADRFASAQELVQQVRRFLAGEPVACYPDPWIVRLRRWMGRHRMLVTGTAAAAVVAILSLATATLLLTRANDRERASRLEAEDNLRLAQNIVDRYLVQVSSDERLKSQGLEKFRRDLLLQAKEIYEQFVRRGANTPEVRLQRASALHGLGLIEAELGDPERARERYEEALALLQQLTHDRPGQGEIQDRLARVARDLGLWHWHAQQLTTAQSYFDQALAIHRQQAEEPGATDAQRYQLAVTLHRFGMFSLNTGEPDRAREVLEQAATVLKQLAEGDPRNPDYQHTLASCYLTLNYALRRLHLDDQVQPLLEQALKVREQLNRTHRDVPVYQQEYGNLLLVLADWLGGSNEKADQHAAVPIYQQALAVFEKLAYFHPDVPQYKIKCATVLLGFGTFCITIREPEPLKDTLEKTRSVLEQLARDHPEVPDYPLLRFQCSLIEAGWHALLGRHGRAAELLEQQRAELARISPGKEAAGPAYFNIACYYCLAAEAARRDPQLDEPAREKAAENYLRQAFEVLKQGQAAGYFGKKNTVLAINTDKDLKLLRERPDFETWLKTLEAP